MNKNIFIITSTINTNYGLIHPDDRLKQTIETIDSIRSNAPLSTIIMVENSSYELNVNLIEYLKKKVDYFIDIGSRKICKTFNRLGIKGAGESYMLLVGLDLIKSTNMKSDRIFKISGRYKLTDNFNINSYSNCTGKFCFKKRGHNFLHTRLWSGCGSKLDSIIDLTKKSLQSHLELNITIEEAIFKNLNFDQLVEFDELHCEGYIAPWNILIKD